MSRLTQRDGDSYTYSEYATSRDGSCCFGFARLKNEAIDKLGEHEDMLAKITYPKRVQIIVNKPPFSIMLPVVDLLTFKANLRKFKPLSIVNYGDKRYSSVVVEERPK